MINMLITININTIKMSVSDFLLSPQGMATIAGLGITVVAAAKNYRLGPFAVKDISATLVGNMWVAEYLAVSPLYTIVPIYLVGHLCHKVFRFETPGSKMIDSIFTSKPKTPPETSTPPNTPEPTNDDK